MNNHLRELRGSTKQKEVAKQVGITTSYYGMIETGSRKPSLDVAMRLAKHFNVSAESIFFDTANNNMLCE